ncbi:MAG: P-loop NTPase fold protein [Clostridia bacterium]|nr:P-loop NTPase fold protein [Clostridia bacterium]
MEELIECICDYIRKPYTDYAVMLNGEWGSGKTYFWNNKLRSRIESIKNVEGKNYKTIYMSLYGINSLEEISKKIFIETNPMINKTLKKFVDTREGNVIPEYVKTGLDMANLFGSTSFSSDKVDFSKMFAIDDKILCFDDLERANVDVIDILGYINNFVEHDGIKTILICNEKELATKFKNNNVEMKTLIATYILDKEGSLSPKTKKLLALKEEDVTKVNDKPLANLIEDKISDIFDKANAYERIKEKLIGETFEYVPEYSYILSGMIMKYAYNDELSDFYKRNTSQIISAFKQSNTRNLRILKHALNDFEKIFNEVMKNHPTIDKDILKTMLTFTIAVSFEIKAGNVSKEKLKSISNNDEYNSVIFTSKILNDNSQFYLREFDNRYFLNDFSKYKFFKFVEVYVRTRFFDDKLFNENMESAKNISRLRRSGETKRYLKLLNGDYWKLSDFDFDLLWNQVLEEIKTGKVEFKEHVKLFAIIKYLMNLALIEYPISELKQNFILGMQLSASENMGAIEVLQDSKVDSDVDYDIDDKDIEEIKNEYINIKNKAICELATSKASELFKNLPDNLSEFYRQIVGDYKDLPVFSRYDMENLYEKLLLTPNYDIYNIINMIQIRYKENRELLEADSKNLRKLTEIIKKNKANKEKTIKYALLDNLAVNIEKIIK